MAFLLPFFSRGLATIFGASKVIDGGGNTSLTYTAPKQPKKQGNSCES